MKKPNYSTRELYTDNLFRFDKWLRGREKNFRLEFPDNGGGLKTVEVHFDNVEELFRAFKSEINVYGQREYIKIIKQYLLDSMHEGKMVSSMANAKSAILSYFEKNDCPLPPFSIDLTTKYEMADMQPAITREDLLRMLIDRRVSIRDVAIIMNVWHRGLDESTFVEEFNYKAWDQIVKVLGTDYEHWDLDKCPIPIWVRRIKTDALTLGCIERDAVTFLAKWLKVREQILLCPMKSGEPLFINGRKNPITERDIWFQFKSLAIQAGLQMTLPGYKLVTRYKFHAHELRDLLKTTCTEAGVQTEYSEAFICHKAFSSYDKLQQSDTERYRQEYSKLSPYINIFSNSISNAKITTEISKKAQKIETLEKGFTDMQERLTKVEKEKEEMREMIERLRHSRIPEQQQTS